MKKHLLTLSISLLLGDIAFANYVGNPTNQFVPPVDEKEFATVHSSTMLGSGKFVLGLFGNLAYNTLPIFERNGELAQSRTTLYDRSVFVEPAVGIGLTDWIQISLGAPHLVYEEASGDEDYRGEFLKNGVIEYHLGSKFRLYQKDGFGVAGVVSVNIQQLQNDPYSQEVEQKVYNSQLVVSQINESTGYSLNLGYRYFNSFNIPDNEVESVEPVSDQFIWSTGLYYAPHRQHRIIGELTGAIGIYPRKETSDRDTKSSEFKATYRYTYFQTATYAGVGTEIQHGIGTPSWRFYTGFKWQFPGRYDGLEVAQEPKLVEEVVIMPIQKEHIITNTECVPSTNVVEDALVGVALADAQPIKEFVLNDIRFKFDSDELVFNEHNQTVVDFANFIKGELDYKKIVIIGHADSTGSSDYNRKLSLRRANAVKRFLVLTNDLDPQRIETRGLGEEAPVATNATDVGRAMNRRVVIQIF